MATILESIENHRIAFIVQPYTETWLKKRSSLDIISTILEAASGGIGKTRLLEKANLTTSQFRKYSRLLVTKKLLIETIEGTHQAYKTTELGIQYVTLYGAIKSTLYLNSMAEY
jgi:predicted transcriptional regulator